MVKPIYLINNLEDYMKTNTLNRKHIQDVLSIYCSFPFIVENPDLETQKVLETQNDMAFAEMPIFIASAKVV